MSAPAALHVAAATSRTRCLSQSWFVKVPRVALRAVPRDGRAARLKPRDS